LLSDICSIRVRVRYTATARRKEGVELPLGFMVKPRKSRIEEERKKRERRKETRSVRILLLIFYLGL